MTVPTCGTPHYDYSESLCTEPAGHYIRDRDPHAAPLIIDGRQCGGLAWDEPEPPVTDRHTVNSITSDALDELYADLDQARQHSAAIVRVRAELDRIEDFAKRRDDSTTGPYLDAVDALRAALDQPTLAATEATEHHYLSTGCLHDDHAYCQGMTGLNGSKRPGECKHCGTKCICACHTGTIPARPTAPYAQPDRPTPPRP